MKSRFIFLGRLTVFAAVLFHCVPILAQSGGEPALQQIRSRMMQAMRENEELADENARLKTVLIGLQLELDRSRDELELLKVQNPERAASFEALSKENEGAQFFLDDISVDDPLLREARDIYMSGSDMALTDEQQLRELYLYNLQYEIQELQLDRSELQVSLQNIEAKRRAELDMMEEEIGEIMGQEKGLRNRGAELQKNVINFPKEIELYKVENKRLKQMIDRLRKQLSQ